jgi:hypothetical protein
MPNGGMLPSCWVCQWAQRADLLKPVYCQRHQMTILGAPYTFCSELSDDSSPGLANFVQENNIRDNDIYVWIETGYRNSEDSSVPRYRHEFVALAPIATLASWSEDEQQEARKALREKRAQDMDRLRAR